MPFCETEPETLYVIKFSNVLTQGNSGTILNLTEAFLSNQHVRLSLQNVIFGIISKQCPSIKIPNY